MKVDLVISRYNEKIDWISKLNPDKFNLFIYDKGEKHTNFESIKLSNYGREGETYLYHIIDNYKNLSDYTVFLQGNPLEHMAGLANHGFDNVTCYCDYQSYDYEKCSNMLVDFLNNLEPKFDFFEIGDVHHDLGYIDEKNKLVNDLGLEKSISYFTPGAQFIVNKKLILNKPKKFWKNLHKLFLSNNGKYCSITIGYVIERLWVNIFKTKKK